MTQWQLASPNRKPWEQLDGWSYGGGLAGFDNLFQYSMIRWQYVVLFSERGAVGLQHWMVGPIVGDWTTGLTSSFNGA
jgi:hypothetical protein